MADLRILEQDEVTIITATPEQCANVWKEIEAFMLLGRQAFVLDLAPCAFLTSLNIAAIIMMRNKVIANHGRVALANLNDTTKAVFKTLKLDRFFALEYDVATAIKIVR